VTFSVLVAPDKGDILFKDHPRLSVIPDVASDFTRKADTFQLTSTLPQTSGAIILSIVFTERHIDLPLAEREHSLALARHLQGGGRGGGAARIDVGRMHPHCALVNVQRELHFLPRLDQLSESDCPSASLNLEVEGARQGFTYPSRGFGRKRRAKGGEERSKVRARKHERQEGHNIRLK